MLATMVCLSTLWIGHPTVPALREVVSPLAFRLSFAPCPTILRSSLLEADRRAQTIPPTAQLRTFAFPNFHPTLTAHANPASPSQDRDIGYSVATDNRTLVQHQERWQTVHRVLKVATAGSLVVTGLLGTIVAINQPTLFGRGRCAAGDPIFGPYGCTSLSTVHGGMAVTSLVLYTATGVLSLATPRMPGATHPRLEFVHRALTYVHLAGMVIQPVLGILSRFPDVIGIDSTEHRRDFSEVTRTVHIGLGYLTVAAFVTTTLLDF